MLTIGIFVLVFILSLVAIVASDPYDISSPIVLSFFVCSFAGAITMGIISETAEMVVSSQEDTQLRALDSSSELSGSFFLGSGSINDKEVYKYITIRPDGGFEFDSMKVTDAVIYEIPGNSAIIRTTHYKPASRLWTFFGSTPQVSFHVPVGSVQEPEYTISTD